MEYVTYAVAFLVIVITICRVYKIISYILYSRTPRAKINELGNRLWKDLYGEEISKSGQSIYPDIEALMAEGDAEDRFKEALKKAYPSADFSDVEKMGGKYLAYLILCEPTIYGREINQDARDAIIATSESRGGSVQLYCVSLVKTLYGKEEARKYALDIITGKLK